MTNKCGNCPAVKFFCNCAKTSFTYCFPMATSKLLAAVWSAIGISLSFFFKFYYQIKIFFWKYHFSNSYCLELKINKKQKKTQLNTLCWIISFVEISIQFWARLSFNWEIFSFTIFSTVFKIKVLWASVNFIIVFKKIIFSKFIF